MKINLKYFLIAGISFFVLTSCNNSGGNWASELNNDKSSGKIKDFDKQSAISVLAQSKEISEDFAISEFKKYLIKINENHTICSYCPDKGIKVVVGDLNSDNLLDVIVQYQFEQNEEDKQFGQSGIYGCVGFVVFINNRGTLDVSQKVDVSDILTYSVSESVTIKKIEDNGEIILEKLVDRKWDDSFNSERDEQYLTKTYKTKIALGKIAPIVL